jgi:hypothetical protein
MRNAYNSWLGSSSQDVNGATLVNDLEVRFILILIIVFLSSDFVDGLRNPKAVENLQLGFCHLLFKYLKSRSGSSARAAGDMGQAMMMGAYARELTEIETMRLRI